MLEALCEHLLEKPELYQDEMAVLVSTRRPAEAKPWEHNFHSTLSIIRAGLAEVIGL